MADRHVLTTQRFDRPGSILIFGDGPLASYLREHLRLLNHKTTIAPNEGRAVNAIVETHPDLIILCTDVLLEKTPELCRRIKNDDHLRDIPVLVISHVDDPHEQMQAFESGANDVVVRPRSRMLLGARVRTLLKYRNAVQEFKSAQEHLERRVKERTAALEASNAILMKEMNDREQAESALRESEEKVRQIQKVEALGQLAGGVAHDFNNLLCVIMGFCESARLNLEPGHKSQRSLAQIDRAATRASELTRQLLAFGRQQALNPRVLDLNTIVNQSCAMLQRLIGEDIALRVIPGEDLWRVRADPVQVEQVLLNLAVNARDAMNGGGTLLIETENLTLDDTFVKQHVGCRRGPHVRVTVTDTGCGMDAATQKRIFEPFFTTKARGKGTGLGLATVYGIMKQSGGNICVESTPGQGSRFEVYLPRTEERPSSVQMQTVAKLESLHGEVVLVVEDEPHVREIVSHMLEAAGYEVLTASGPDEALALCQTPDKHIRLMLTDVIMPGMNGIELAKQVQEQRPDIRMLYMSGHSDELVKNLAGGDWQGDFLQKPFQSQTVLSKIRLALQRPVSAKQH